MSRHTLITRLVFAASVSLFAQAALAGDRTLVTMENPVFPSEALDEGVSSGWVKVKLTVSAAGGVTAMEIVDSQPKKVFDKAVKRAVSNWKYAPGAANETIETTLKFLSK
jgi:periplasmic protein TonB